MHFFTKKYENMRFWGALGALKWTPLGPKAPKKGPFFEQVPGTAPGPQNDPKKYDFWSHFGVVFCSFF